MRWETHCSPHLLHKVKGKTKGTIVVSGHQGSSIALITGTKEEMMGRIIGMAHPKWRP
jgi:hypothetical protein